MKFWGAAARLSRGIGWSGIVWADLWNWISTQCELQAHGAAYWRWGAADWFFKNRMMSARARGDGAGTVRWRDAYASLRARR